MPAMSPTMEEGGIVEWKVNNGQNFSAGDVLLDIETDKAEISVEAVDDGVLLRILKGNGSKGIKVGKPIAVMGEPGDTDDVDAFLTNFTSNDSNINEPLFTTTQSNSGKSNVTEENNGSLSMSTDALGITKTSISHGTLPLPSALRLLNIHGVKANEVKGSGPFGRITKGDILAYLGKIPKDYPIIEQNRIKELGKPNLKHIKAPSEIMSNPLTFKTEPVIKSVVIPLTECTVTKVNSAKQKALRLAMLSLKPKPSILRSTTLDLLTSPKSLPFFLRSVKINYHRGKPVALDVIIEESPSLSCNSSVAVFINVLKSELGHKVDV